MIELIFGLIVFFGVPGTFAYLLTFQTMGVVRFLARNQRQLLKDIYRLSDAEIDKLPLISGSAFYIGSHREFITHALDHPEEFTNLINHIQAVAALIWGFLIFAAAIILSSLASGQLKVGY